MYGTVNLTKYLDELTVAYSSFEIFIYQSNSEGELVDYLQKIRHQVSGIIINPAAYTHTSIALRDALALQQCPIIEVHISAVSHRENFRQTNLIKDYSWSIIEAKGIEGYRIALDRMKEFLEADRN